MKEMFRQCSSLSSLPDISKWNTNNVENMSRMFFYCSSLSSLPDLSKGNTKNVKDMSKMFDNCPLLLFIPNLLKIERHSFYSNSSDSDFINDCNNIIGSDDEINNNNFNSQNIFKNKYLKKLNENSDIYFPSYNSKEDIKDKINMSLDDALIYL